MTAPELIERELAEHPELYEGPKEQVALGQLQRSVDQILQILKARGKVSGIQDRPLVRSRN